MINYDYLFVRIQEIRAHRVVQVVHQRLEIQLGLDCREIPMVPSLLVVPVLLRRGVLVNPLVPADPETQ